MIITEKQEHLVSVVIPVYNAEKTIEQTVMSVVNQTYNLIEIIAVNDGSTDNSIEILKRLRASYIDVMPICIIDQENGGVSKARNIGMKCARGKYIALLDADDVWLPNKLAKQIEILLANPHIDFLGTSRNGQVLKRWFFKRFSYLTPISAKLLLYKTFFVTPTVIFRRDVLNDIGYFDETQRYAEEGNYWIRIAQRKRCFLLNESFVITGNGKPNFGFSGLSSNLLEMEKGELKNMRLGHRLGIVKGPEYGFLVVYSLLKYLRRIIIVKLRN